MVDSGITSLGCSGGSSDPPDPEGRYETARVSGVASVCAAAWDCRSRLCIILLRYMRRSAFAIRTS